MMNRGRIFLFGSLQLIPGSGAKVLPLEIGSEKLQALLAYLILHQQQPVERRKLGGCLWPHANETSARRNLREYLYRARQVLAEFSPEVSMLEAEDDSVIFTPPPECWIDTVEFEQLTRRAKTLINASPRNTPISEVDRDQGGYQELISLLQQAIDLYRQDLLVNLYDDWVIAERERWRALFVHNLDQLSQALQMTGVLIEAITTTQRLLEYNPLHEAAHRRLIELYYASGDRARALYQYQLCCQTLTTELAVEPMPETQALYQAILKGTYLRTVVNDSVLPGEPQLERCSEIPLVGRQDELARLTLRLAQSRTAKGKIVIISGDNGVGKTRLVHEWLANQPGETLVLQGQGYEFEQDIPYRPLLDALQQSLHLLSWTTLPPHASSAWLAPLAQLLPDLYTYRPDLAAATPPADAEPAPYLLAGLAQLLLSFTRQAPVILFLDDLHWADRPTWQFLFFLARRANTLPLFIVCTFSLLEATAKQRTQVRSLEEKGFVHLLSLSGLGLADIAELASSMLNCPAEAIAPLVKRLYQETGGNLFFVIETLKALLKCDIQPPYLPTHLDQLPLPTTIQTSIENRLARLTPASRQALAVAAAVGREFTFDLLVTISHLDEDELLNYLDDWLARGLVVERVNGCYDFRQQQVREVAYQSLSRPRQRRTHFRIAQALEAAASANIDLVAHHYRLSDQSDRVLPDLQV